MLKNETEAKFKIRLIDNYTLDSVDKEKIAWLREHAYELKDTNNNYDIKAVEQSIGDARVVFLGEITHLDAEVNTVKTEIVKALHKNMGFKHIAFESDLYAANVLQEALDSNSEDPLIWPRAILSIWSTKESFVDLIQYVDAHKGGSNKLSIHGIDSLFRNFPTWFFFNEKLKEFLAVNNITATDNLYEVSDFIIKKRRKARELPEEQKRAFYKEIDAIIEQLTQLKDDKTNKFWIKCLKAFRNSAYFDTAALKSTPTDKNMRDKLMAENLQILLDELPENEKVIVWAASYHNARNLHKQTSTQPNVNFKEKKTMGQYYMESPKYSYYSIAFTAYEGEWGDDKYDPNDTNPKTLRHKLNTDQHESLELEEMFYFADFNHAFLNLKPYAKSKHWLNSPIVGRIFGHEAIMGRWPELFDGIIFLRKVSPTKRAAWVHEEGRKLREKRAKEAQLKKEQLQEKPKN